MKIIKKIIFFIHLTSVICRPQFSVADDINVGSQDQEIEQLDSPIYSFNYAVKDEESGNDFSHEESREDNLTQGRYIVLLPDGRLKIVSYFDRGDGFHANVQYEGEAIHPFSKEILLDRQSRGHTQPIFTGNEAFLTFRDVTEATNNNEEEKK